MLNRGATMIEFRKSKNYYRFIAPAMLAKKGIEINKENIDKFVQAELYGGEDNSLSNSLLLNNNTKQVYFDKPLDINAGDVVEISYKVGEGGIQTVKGYATSINGLISLSDNREYSESIYLVGDIENNIALFVYCNSKDLEHINNGAVIFVSTVGHYNNDMPNVNILSIDKL